MLKWLTERRTKDRQIHQLEETIGQIYFRETLGKRGTPEFEDAYRTVIENKARAENQLKFIRQKDLLIQLGKEGITVPTAYIEKHKWPLRDVLSDEGETWARHEVKKISRNEIEFWAKIVLPILSLLLSIVALLWKK